MNSKFIEYFRCPEDLIRFDADQPMSASPGFFTFGGNTIGYGRCSHASPSVYFEGKLPDISEAVNIQEGSIRLPFNLSQVVDNLRNERYTSGRGSSNALDGAFIRRMYYFIRPSLPVPVRKHLQKSRLRGWDTITFPRWPIDCTVDTFLRSVLTLVLKTTGTPRIPFIWFWPDGATGCAIMTHDVETLAGRNSCDHLMDLDDSFAIKSAFQIIPETRYDVPESFLQNLRNRGFEVNVHDLNHDGSLFLNRQEFLRRAEQINHYGKAFQCQGFRAGAMYRNQEWFDAFDFSYDMSVPSVAHLEPQRGGCCTVMPYFIGKILELPMTTTQDYSLFHILGKYSTELWKEQIELILQNNGLITVGCHPDYLAEPRAEAVYLDLLAHLVRLRTERNVWITLPGNVNQWWRDRHQMVLVPDGGAWRIEGPSKDRARIAYAYLDNHGQLVYSLERKESELAADGQSHTGHATAGKPRPTVAPND